MQHLQLRAHGALAAHLMHPTPQKVIAYGISRGLIFCMRLPFGESHPCITSTHTQTHVLGGVRGGHREYGQCDGMSEKEGIGSRVSAMVC